MEKIRVIKHFDGDKVEYSFINFDYIDGSDYIAQFFVRNIRCGQMKNLMVYGLV